MNKSPFVVDRKKNEMFFMYYEKTTRLARKRRVQTLQRDAVVLREKRSPVSCPIDRNINYWSSVWGNLLVNLTAIENGPSIDLRAGMLFRRRFRVPWQVYCDLVMKCKAHKLFGENSLSKYDMCGATICPIEIKLLCVLRMLGRNWCSDDIAEATGMGESTAQLLFLTFCKNFVAEFYEATICRPQGEKLTRMMAVYEKMGLPGCIGYTDCVHIKWDRCPVTLTNVCKGKEGYPSLVHSCTVNHHRRILGVTRSNYGTRNDKTIVRLDSYITGDLAYPIHHILPISYLSHQLPKSYYAICNM